MDATHEPSGRPFARAARCAWAFLVDGLCGLSMATGGPPPAQPGAALLECPACGRRCACPAACAPSEEGRTRLRLRCGACEAWREVELTPAQAAAYDRALGRHLAAMERDLHRLERERTAAELDAFAAALWTGLIDASSFGPPATT